jgi:hypothetical protein
VVTDLAQVVEIDPGAVTDLAQVVEIDPGAVTDPVLEQDQARDRNQPRVVVVTDPVQWIENQAQRKDRALWIENQAQRKDRALWIENQAQGKDQVRWIDRGQDRVVPSVANGIVEALHRGTVNVVR